MYPAVSTSGLFGVSPLTPCPIVFHGSMQPQVIGEYATKPAAVAKAQDSERAAAPVRLVTMSDT